MRAHLTRTSGRTTASQESSPELRRDFPRPRCSKSESRDSRVAPVPCCGAHWPPRETHAARHRARSRASARGTRNQQLAVQSDAGDGISIQATDDEVRTIRCAPHRWRRGGGGTLLRSGLQALVRDGLQTAPGDCPLTNPSAPAGLPDQQDTGRWQEHRGRERRWRVPALGRQASATPSHRVFSRIESPSAPPGRRG